MLQIEYGKDNKILRTIATDINQKDYNSAIKLGKEMLKYIRNPDNGGIGLAAPQIGKSIRLIVVGLPKTWEDEHIKFMMMINPVITHKSEETRTESEGCLSLPGEKGPVTRANEITVEFINEKKNKQKLIFEGVAARVVQHEVDHLDGILFTDYA